MSSPVPSPRKRTLRSSANGSASSASPDSFSSPTTPAAVPPKMPLRTSPAARSPFLPTRLEALLISIYPATLLLGSVFSTLSPASRNAPYSTTSQSHPPEHAPSYFARKRNIFNIYFVKVGWFWTTVAFVLFLVLNPALGSSLASKRRIQAVLRYCAVTTYWVFITQWFFGAPIIDRSFRLTGGACEVALNPAHPAHHDMSSTKKIVTAAACKAGGGMWIGGHDISGHVFLLILGSSFLWSEILPALTRAEGLRDGRRIRLPDGKLASVAVEKQRSAPLDASSPSSDSTTGSGETMRKGVKFALSVLGLMWWMLLMTAAYFHTWFEKFTGLLVAFLGLWTVYFMPRGRPEVRAVLGMPGV